MKLKLWVALALGLASCAPLPKPPITPDLGPGTTSPTPQEISTPVTLYFAPSSFAALPNWQGADDAAARAAFLRSCLALKNRNADAFLSNAAPYAGRVREWAGVCQAAGNRNLSDQTFFESAFQPWAVSSPAGETGKLTSYYEPELAVSTRKTPEHDTPIQARPADLIIQDLGLNDPSLTGRTAIVRLRDGQFEPYPERGEITEASAPVLAWGNAADVFFLQVQGSGRLVFDDGSIRRAAFAAHNGRPFKSIGAELVRRGELTRDQASADAIKVWMARNGPEAARNLMAVNPRMVFFSLETIADPSAGPRGAQQVPLSAGASMAVDATVHPYGVPVFISAEAPILTATDTQRTLQRLVVTQDTGGAIIGPLRGDLFWGTGQAAGLAAGRINHGVRWWVLLPKGLDPVVTGSAR